MKFGMLLLVVCVTLSCPQHALPDKSVSSEEYAIYAAVLGWHLKPGKVKTFALNAATRKADQDHCPSFLNSLASLVKWRSAEQAYLIADFISKNQNSIALEKRFPIQQDYVLLKESEAIELFSSMSADGKHPFFEQYPNASGFGSFSRIGFDRTQTKAAVMFENLCGGLCGGGAVFLLEKGNDGWKVIETIHCYVA